MPVNRPSAGSLVLRLLVAAGLVVDAVIHLHLAAGYQLAQPSGIGEGNLFRIESAMALVAAAYVLVRASRPAYALAAVVALGGLAAVLLSRYVNVPAFGPIPSVYEPIWFFQKVLSAVSQAVAGVLALVGVFHRRGAQRSAVDVGS
ncbi:MAG: hypothetical protein M3Z50_02425 [Actinomycetota bacterium]|nr:hypothetical protein [Actinomycetota bacterium]